MRSARGKGEGVIGRKGDKDEFVLASEITKRTHPHVSQISDWRGSCGSLQRFTKRSHSPTRVLGVRVRPKITKRTHPPKVEFTKRTHRLTRSSKFRVQSSKFPFWKRQDEQDGWNGFCQTKPKLRN